MTPPDKLPLREIVLCIEAACDAYEPSLAIIQTPAAHVLIRSQPGMIVVAFRGTQGIRDVITDVEAKMDICAVESDGAAPDAMFRVHSGFLRSTRGVMPGLVAKLQALYASCAVDGNPPAVWFTGHSLGGAQATMATVLARRYWLASATVGAKFDISGIVTFGSPRVGDAAFRKAYAVRFGQRTWRFENHMDVIPLVPTLLMGYRHVVGAEMFTESLGQIIAHPKWGRILVTELAGAFKGEIDDLERDHGAALYREKVHALLPRFTG